MPEIRFKHITERFADLLGPEALRRGWHYIDVIRTWDGRRFDLRCSAPARFHGDCRKGDDGLYYPPPRLPEQEWGYAVDSDVIVNAMDRIDPIGFLALRRPDGYVESRAVDKAWPLIKPQIPVIEGSRPDADSVIEGLMEARRIHETRLEYPPCFREGIRRAMKDALTMPRRKDDR